MHAVGQMEAADYAKVAFQWAKALRLLDPSIKIISCGGTGDVDSRKAHVLMFAVQRWVPQSGIA